MRYPDSYVQSIPVEELKKLPAFCEYRGDADDLVHLKGKLIPTVQVESLVYVGERENIWVTRDDGSEFRPWAGVYIIGGEQAPAHDALPTYGPDAMSRADLAALGYTDDDLAALAREHLHEEWAPDRSGPSDRRREMFNRVMAATTGESGSS